MTWDSFELACTDYLNERFGSYANFTHQGGADSTTPDIFVETKDGASFYIEAKNTPAQCGQFVLLPNIEDSTFEYSRQNANRINKYAKEIMDHMNHSFDEYRDAGTAGKSINMINGEEVFSNWVIDTYGAKGVRYFIINDFTLFQINQFRDHLEITAKYRIKRSGSSYVGRSRIKDVADYVKCHDYSINEIRPDGDKLYVFSKKNLHDHRFILGAYEYMFSARDEKYEIRKLSNTYNANVIFTVLNKHRSGMSDAAFIAGLNR